MIIAINNLGFENKLLIPVIIICIEYFPVFWGFFIWGLRNFWLDVYCRIFKTMEHRGEE